jgi:hypothetical protein
MCGAAGAGHPPGQPGSGVDGRVGLCLGPAPGCCRSRGRLVSTGPGPAAVISWEPSQARGHGSPGFPQYNLRVDSAILRISTRFRARAVADREPTIGSRRLEERAMQARRLLQQAPFDGPTVQMLCQVLDEGWASIDARLDAAGESAVRKNLADAILAMARAGHRNPIVLRLHAVSRARALLDGSERRPQRSASK